MVDALVKGDALPPADLDSIKEDPEDEPPVAALKRSLRDLMDQATVAAAKAASTTASSITTAALSKGAHLNMLCKANTSFVDALLAELLPLLPEDQPPAPPLTDRDAATALASRVEELHKTVLSLHELHRARALDFDALADGVKLIKRQCAPAAAGDDAEPPSAAPESDFATVEERQAARAQMFLRLGLDPKVAKPAPAPSPSRVPTAEAMAANDLALIRFQQTELQQKLDKKAAELRAMRKRRRDAAAAAGAAGDEEDPIEDFDDEDLPPPKKARRSTAPEDVDDDDDEVCASAPPRGGGDEKSKKRKKGKKKRSSDSSSSSSSSNESSDSGDLAGKWKAI